MSHQKIITTKTNTRRARERQRNRERDEKNKRIKSNNTHTYAMETIAFTETVRIEQQRQIHILHLFDICVNLSCGNFNKLVTIRSRIISVGFFAFLASFVESDKPNFSRV